jgi:hypothetical protein
MSQHTPGEWIWKEVNDFPEGKHEPLVGVARDGLLCGHYIARLFHPDGGRGVNSHSPPSEESYANACLIAAAPDLLAACKSALGTIEMGGVFETLQYELKKAIAKAETTP